MKNQHKPIFIGGLQRSGTSLVRGILGSHPTLAFMQWDLPLWTYFYDRYKHTDLNDITVRRQLIDKILAHEKVQEASVSLDRDAILQALDGESFFTCGVVFDYVLREYAKKVGKPRWCLKTPHNEFHAEAIFEAYPTAKMIHMIRDPRDVAVSMKSIRFKWDLIEHPKQWQDSVRLARFNGQKYAGSYITVRYEDLVSDPQRSVQEICKVVELEYAPDLLKMDKHPGWEGGNSTFSDIGRQNAEISQSAIGRYVNELSGPEIWFYQRQLRDDMQRWQYRLQPMHLSTKQRWTVMTVMLEKFCRTLQGWLEPLEGRMRGIYRLRYWLRKVGRGLRWIRTYRDCSTSGL